MSPLRKPKQKPNSQFLGKKTKIWFIVRFFYIALFHWDTFTRYQKCQNLTFKVNFHFQKLFQYSSKHFCPVLKISLQPHRSLSDEDMQAASCNLTCNSILFFWNHIFFHTANIFNVIFSVFNESQVPL